MNTKPNYVVTTVDYDKVGVVTYKEIKETQWHLIMSFTICTVLLIFSIFNTRIISITLS